MAAGSTYTPIATVSTTASSYTFSSIPSTYTDLILIGSLRSNKNSASTDTLFLTFNGDTTSGLYSSTRLFGNGSAASSSRQTDQNQIAVPEIVADTTAANVFAPTIIQVMNYKNSTTFKTALNRTNTAGDLVGAIVGLWRNTNAITSLTVAPASGSFMSGSTLTLYGIASA